jgi:hypothetical protein
MEVFLMHAFEEHMWMASQVRNSCDGSNDPLRIKDVDVERLFLVSHYLYKKVHGIMK